MKLSNDKSHYVSRNKKYPRLSDIMSVIPNYGLQKWKDKVGEDEANRIANESSEYGTKIHLITAYHDLGKNNKVDEMARQDPTLLPHLFAWIEYWEKYIRKFVAIEKVVWSDELRVAGTIDRVDLFVGDRKLCIHDIKSGPLWDEIGIRLAGYKIMWNEREKRKVDRCMAVQLPRDYPGVVNVKEYYKKEYEVRFREACETYHKMYG